MRQPVNPGPVRLHESLGGSWSSLDDAKTLLAARRDSGGFVRESQRPLFVDEVQRAGNPFILAVKGAVDIDNRPGQFILAGSIATKPPQYPAI